MPELLVVHYTGGLSCDGALRWLRSQASGVSAHFVVARDGRVAQLVDLDRAAWHCGRSEYSGVRGCNARSIGVELCNAGLLGEDPDGYHVSVGGQELRYRGPDPIACPLALPDGRVISGWWEPYAPEQVTALRALVTELRAEGYRLDVRGHHEVARPVGRKIDPGPLLDLEALRSTTS